MNHTRVIHNLILGILDNWTALYTPELNHGRPFSRLTATLSNLEMHQYIFKLKSQYNRLTIKVNEKRFLLHSSVTDALLY